MSIAEVLSNQVVGFIISVAFGMWIFPRLGFPITLGNSVLVTSTFALLSMIRSYGMRRLFNWIGNLSKV
jgi:hypothetical protein